MAKNLKMSNTELPKLSKELKKMRIQIRVGILGNGDLASIGAVQEFGVKSKNIPSRSFLRLSFEKQPEEVNKIIQNRLSGNYNNAKTVIAFENLIDNAFRSSGFGLWKALKVRVGGKPLIDTGALRRSIKATVKGKES